jgi:SAM-dependent methyltransferase
MSDVVQAQYESYPYPPRNPEDERKRLITGSPSHLDELVHYVFGGHFNPAAPFRALIAGGGTGDAAIMLAQQLADEGATRAEIIYLDWSAASRRVAEARAAVRNLSNLRFVTGSLLDLDRLALGTFDYIDCCGVLHHLPDPDAGLATLTRALAPRGGMGLMLYAPLGRTGVYPMQALLRDLTAADPPSQRVALARRLLDQMPATNWLKRNPFVTDHLVEGDPGLYDLLLHERDRAYDVEEVYEFIARAGLRLVNFVPPARYEIASYVSDAALLKRAASLDMRAHAAAAERLCGNLKTHVFYVVRSDNDVGPPRPDSLDIVPRAVNADFQAMAKAVKPGGFLQASAEGVTLRRAMPRLAPAILQRIDGRRSLGGILKILRGADPRLEESTFINQFAEFHIALVGIGKLALRRIVGTD